MLNIQSLPSAGDVALAKLSSQVLSALLSTSEDVQYFTIAGKEGDSHSLKLPVCAVKLMIEVLTHLGQGHSVNIIPIHSELTTQDAADILSISRPTFIKLLDSGVLAHTRTGNRRKVAFVDVLKYKQDIEAKRLNSLDELSAVDQELNLEY